VANRQADQNLGLFSISTKLVTSFPVEVVLYIGPLCFFALKMETSRFFETLAMIGNKISYKLPWKPEDINKNAFSFQSMLRVQKKYIFPYKVLPHSNNTVPGHVITFSSYPGTIQSGDDFYVTSAGLATLETTTGNSNHSLWQYVKPEGQVGGIF
jgi:hypothetical protein